MEGLLTDATAEKRGVMSAFDKKTGLWQYSIQGYCFYEILKEDTMEWQRSNALIFGSIDEEPVGIIIGYYRQSGSTISVKIKWLTEKSSKVKFYRKGVAIYVFFDLEGTSPNTIRMSSKNGVKLINKGSQPDSSYTLIE